MSLVLYKTLFYNLVMKYEEFVNIDIIREFSDYILKKNYSNNTYIAYLNDLYYFYLFVKKDLTLVTEDDIRKYLEYLNEKYSKIYREKKMRFLFI